jgi:hypothetical protein
MEIERMLVTPELAARLLERNPHNRNLNAVRVKQYAQKMREGRWVLTHQGVALNGNGNLVDGQHRLAAIVASGCAVEMLVTSGVHERDVIDTGRSRTLADVLSIYGHTNARMLSASLRYVMAYEAEVPRPWQQYIRDLDAERLRVKADQIGEQVNRFGQLAQRISRRINGNKSAYMAALYIIADNAEGFGGSLPELTADWMEGLGTGQNLGPRDPRLALASWVNGAGNFYRREWQYELTFVLTLRAYHASLRGEPLNKLLVRDAATYNFRLPVATQEAAG